MVRARWIAALLMIGALGACDGLPVPVEGAGGGLADGGIARLDLGVPRRDAGSPGDAAVVDTRLNSVFPNRGPIAGGTRLRIVGRAFAPGTTVRVGSADCLDLEIESPNHLRCTTPQGRGPEVVSVTVYWPGEVRPVSLEDAFTYFQHVELRAIEPTVGPTTGGLQVEILGAGLVDPTTVRFGGNRAISVEYVDDGRLVAVAPPGEPGLTDVAVTNVNGEVVLAEAFTYTEPLVVESLEPAWGLETGGDAVQLRGTGLLAESAVRFGPLDAEIVESALGRTRLTVRTPPGSPGVVDVELVNANGGWRRGGGFLYVAAEDGPFGATGVVPDRLPATGGARFVVGGNGFGADTRVWLDDEPVACEALSGQALRCTAPPMAPGVVDVIIRDGEAEARLPEGLFFFEEIEVYDVQPPRGAVAGGAVVEVVGRGLTESMRLSFQGNRLEVISVAPGGDTAFARVPPGLPGWVGLVAATDDDTAFLPEAFQYIEPRTRYGGVWGEAIERAVNVTVLDAVTGEPVPEAFVRAAGLDGQGPWTNTTNDVGQATVSAVDLAGPLVVTCAAAGYEVYTFDRVAHENLTAYLYPHEFEQNPGANDQRPPPRLSGTVRGLNDLDKPLEPGMALVAFVETSHTSPYNRTTLPVPNPNGVLLEDGPFEIVSRSGELSVVVTAAYVRTLDLNDWQAGGGPAAYRALRAAAAPVAMGLRRFVSVSPGQVAEGLEVTLDRPLRSAVDVRLVNPSGGVRGAPDTFEASPILDLGPEGYYALDSLGESDTAQMRIPYLPDLRDWDADIDMLWIAETHTEDWTPYSVTFHYDRTLEDGVEIGPIVGTPFPISPEINGSLGPWRTVEWGVHPGLDGPTEPAHANIISLRSPNGLPLWTYVTPGALTQLQLPPLPDIILPGGVVPGEMYLTIETVLVDGRFDYADFTYSDLRRRASYGVFTMPITE